MLNILKPYAVYLFTKSSGVIDVSVVLAPVEADSIQLRTAHYNYDPAYIDRVAIPMCAEVEERLYNKKKEGWVLQSWYLADLNPTENKPGQYESTWSLEILEDKRICPHQPN